MIIGREVINTCTVPKLIQKVFIIFGRKKGIEMLVSIVIILIDYQFNIVIFLFILRLCFKTENLFGAQFVELEKCI